MRRISVMKCTKVHKNFLDKKAISAIITSVQRFIIIVMAIIFLLLHIFDVIPPIVIVQT